MQEFENYIKSNYIIPGAAACAIKYTFTTRETTDKASKIPVIIYTMVMKMTWFDKYGQQLQIEKLIFVNDTLTKSSEKSCYTIAPSEVSNKFRIAKSSIVQTLIEARQEKIDELKKEQSLLTKYLGSESVIIPNEMKPTVQVINNYHAIEDRHISKNKFEM